MAKTKDFLSNVSGKLNGDYHVRETDHGNFLSHNPRHRGVRRSKDQANTRCQLGNMSNNYQLIKCVKMQCFEGKEPGQNDFNIFVQVNYNRNPVFITKQDCKCGGCVLGNYQYSLGSLNPIAYSLNQGGVLVTSIALGGLSITADTTVAQLAQAIIANNKDWQADDQLSFFYAEQLVDSEGVPRATMEPYRVVLSLEDNRKLWAVVSALGFTSVNGNLGMSTALSNAGASWIHSRNDGDGEKKVSTQRMFVVSDILASYQSEAAFMQSAKSYGGINTKDDYLDPVCTMSDMGVASSSGSGTTEQSSGGSGSGSQQGGSSTPSTGSETPAVAAPVISGSTPFEESTQVTMSCSTAGATIHYTVDGTTPTAESTQYTEALTLSDTTTVKAIAVKGTDTSTVSSRTFTKGDGEDVS